MKTLRRSWRKNKKRGQTIVFIILVFQMIFVLMAMMINIGLVVHDKINLQNSVDLAAVYASQRQAEVLNAMAHINYQIRQSYKLMAWRYFVLGSIGANWGGGGTNANYFLTNINPPDSAHCPRIGNGATPSPCSLNDTYNQNNAYAVCMKHPHWHLQGSSGDHLCQKSNFHGSVGIRRPQAVLPDFDIGGGLVGRVFDRLLGGVGLGLDRFIIQNAVEAIADQCKKSSGLNWYMASFFLQAFRMDQWRRKTLIQDLFDKVLVSNQDLTGASLREGVQKTIQKNLTFSNYDHFQNSSLSFTSSSEGKNFNDYFEWEQIFPVLLYVSSTSGNTLNLCDYALVPTFVVPSSIGLDNRDPFYLSSVEAYAHENFSETSKNLFHLSSGFYKKPSSSPFVVQVSVTIDDYKRQIFFPFKESPIQLKATAYAKPFGAVFGPPPFSDTLLPTRNQDYTSTVGTFLANNLPNYSLFPGDSMGLIRKRVQKTWLDLILQNRSSTDPRNEGRTFANYSLLVPETDPLVLNRTPDANQGHEIQRLDSSGIRKLEKAAIAPDLFDLAHYTILPDYMTTLYPKILRNPDLQGGLHGFPGDLGYFNLETLTLLEGSRGIRNLATWREMANEPNYFSVENFRLNFIEDQINSVNEFNTSLPQTIQNLYKVNNPSLVLTSWHSPLPSSDTYGKIGRCDIPNSNSYGVQLRANLFPESEDEEPYNTVPQGCFSGGRSGFSVKLIHSSI